jgi:hypothetical protein
MSERTNLTAPNKAALRALYDEAAAEINRDRNNDQLRTSFYARIGDAVFDAAYKALEDTVADKQLMRVVSAPPGAAKSSFAYAFAAALARYGDANSGHVRGVVFVVNEIVKAQETFTELYKLVPGKVAVWTTEHDVNCKLSESERKVAEPAAVFTKAELHGYPIAVVTHEFYLGTGGHQARNIGPFLRALTIVDEQPNEAPTLAITLSEAQVVRERLTEAYPDSKAHLDALLNFMERYSYEAPNKLFRPGKEVDLDALSNELAWFKTKHASDLVKRCHKTIPGIVRLVAYGKALAIGRAWVDTNGLLPRFFGYQEQRITERARGTVLLDATADIDGISSIVPERLQIETPKASYANLEVIHVPQHTKQRLSEYLKAAPQQHAYAEWMVETIKQHMKPGERGLVVCKKKLIDDQRVPTWPDKDPKFQSKALYTKHYGWNIGGRNLCVIHWGTGIGNNDWQDADVVFLFDQFYRPRRVDIGKTQAYRGHQAHQGDLGSMPTPNSKAKGVDGLSEGHRLRWIKQIALRGKGRFYDAEGVCGKQRLVIASDWNSLRANAHKLFPGARIETVGAGSDSTVATRIIEFLSKTDRPVVLCKELKPVIGHKPWRSVSFNVVTPEFRDSVDALGWKYEKVIGRPKRGQLGTRFERKSSGLGAGALP